MTSNKIITAAFGLPNTMAKTEVTVDRVGPAAAATAWLVLPPKCVSRKHCPFPQGGPHQPCLRTGVLVLRSHQLWQEESKDFLTDPRVVRKVRNVVGQAQSLACHPRGEVAL